MIITIDGPVASGKSTIARLLAKELDFYYLYTGLLYRGIAALLVKELGYTEEDLKHPRKEDLDLLLKGDAFEYCYKNGEAQIYFKGKSITESLKTREVDNWSSISSADPTVRNAIFERQVLIGKQHNMVADGRDTGSVVFPDAAVKIFLTASLEIRAARWQRDQAKMGLIFSDEESKHIVEERDERDRTRTHSPLIKAKDAIVIDSTYLSCNEVVAAIKVYVLQAKNQK